MRLPPARRKATTRWGQEARQRGGRGRQAPRALPHSITCCTAAGRGGKGRAQKGTEEGGAALTLMMVMLGIRAVRRCRLQELPAGCFFAYFARHFARCFVAVPRSKAWPPHRNRIGVNEDVHFALNSELAHRGRKGKHHTGTLTATNKHESQTNTHTRGSAFTKSRGWGRGGARSASTGTARW